MNVDIVRDKFLERQKITLVISKNHEIDESKVIELMQETLKICFHSSIRFDMYQTDKEYIMMLESKNTELITVIWMLQKDFPNTCFNY